MATEENDIKTLYCSGFPLDIQYREVKNIFQFQPGFVYFRLVNGKVPLVFVSFETHEQAKSCLEIMHGGLLDDDSKIELRIEFAKHDKLPPSGAPTGPSKKRGYASNGDIDAEKRARFAGVNPTTIQLHGLSPDTKEREIRDLVTAMTGFKRMRWSPSKRNGGSPLAFADFYQAEDAEEALQKLQGSVIDSVPGGIQAKFSDLVPHSRNRNTAPSRDMAPQGAYHSYAFPPPPQGVDYSSYFPQAPAGAQPPMTGASLYGVGGVGNPYAAYFASGAGPSSY